MNCWVTTQTKTRVRDEMASPPRRDLFEADAATLKRIADQYGKGSPEYAVLERAGTALWYVISQGPENFQHLEGPLSAEQRTHLIQLGFDPGPDP